MAHPDDSHDDLQDFSITIPAGRGLETVLTGRIRKQPSEGLIDLIATVIAEDLRRKEEEQWARNQPPAALPSRKPQDSKATDTR